MTLFARVLIGKNDEFVTGDGILQSLSFTLAEGANSSNCLFTLYDKTKQYTKKYFEYIYQIGGLEPLVRPESSATNPTGQAGTSAVNASANMKAFLDMISLAEGTNTYPNSGYNTRFGGSQFGSYSTHPGTLNGFSAAGRYQVLKATFEGFQRQGLIDDFTPESQDNIAIALIEERGHTGLVESGNVAGALNALDNVWTSFQVKPHSELIAFYNERVRYYTQGGQAQQQATDSTTQETVFGKNPISKSEAGQQITIEVGNNGEIFAAYSFLHQGLDFSLKGLSLTFKGQAATWVLTQRIKTTAYTNLTFSQICKRIADSYGLRLSYKSNIDPKYDYFPQRGVSDYEALLIEARRLGLRMQTKGNILSIYDRRSTQGDRPEFVIEYGDNLGLDFTASHQAQTDSVSGDARSLESQTLTGQRKIELDPELGQAIQTQLDSQTGMGAQPSQVVGGSDMVPTTPTVQSNSDSGASNNVATEHRFQGFTAKIGQLATTSELLLLTPDDGLRTKNIVDPLDRTWIIESISHNFDASSGWKTDIALTLKPRLPPVSESSALSGSSPALNPGGWINPNPGSTLTSRFRTARRPNHQGVDLAQGRDSPIYASQNGTVSDVQNGCPPFTARDRCGGGYGNRIYLEHADGYQTRYAHLSAVNVTVGQTVQQGAVIGTEGNSGASRGVHLHFEIRQGGQALNPEDFYRFLISWKRSPQVLSYLIFLL
ncbi:MAG: peptidoglycan DD-metalloendopeptidase family protein [Leptolyngbyaceae cyanobacterium SL_5_14]|nr:peptidoglycan DD-metalloendopeptidase family protein [Leptolyngbyaceae cyanobacterium SL_5_14]